MEMDPKAVEKGARRPYERPIVVKERRMSFPSKIIAGGRQIVCRQCSACHGCR